jgi:16S rRNA (cytosine1402-N4)-methyltransferase
MLSEVLKAFADVELKVFYEGTLGAGGHAKAILKAHPEIERYIACDKDPQALEIAKKQLSFWKDKIELIHGDFADLDFHLKERGVNQVDGFFLT